VADLVADGQGLSALDWQDLRDLQAQVKLAEADLIEIFAKLGIAANPFHKLAADQYDRAVVLPAGDSSVEDAAGGGKLLALSVETAQVVEARADSGQMSWRIDKRPLQVQGFRERLAEGVELTMVQIPAGSFLMGSPSEEPERSDDEGPQHQVQLQGFFMGQTPITQAQWLVVAGWQKLQQELNSDPGRFKGLHRPVESVLWGDAIEFCQRLSQHFGRTYTLPSEAQWEYACRAGTTTPFHFGATLTPELANYDGNSTYCEGPKGVWRAETTEVASFPANPWGLYDMHGNVWEWCLDQWHDNFQGAPANGSAWLGSSVNKDNKRLLRGGSWYGPPASCRSAYRHDVHPGYRRSSYLGFRVCCLPQGRASLPLIP
jgi:formylglycine-generating enzyme required for sulfatase activity